MPFQGDPHRTLGIPPGATLNEVRSAYRRLAKKYHPDAAGERALPRFLSIQAAYEQLVDGEGRLRGDGAGASGAPSPRPAPGGGARASRDAWRARRAAGTRTGGSSMGRAPGAGPGGGTAGTGPGAGSSGARAGGGDDPGGRRFAGDAPDGRRGSRKATPGSTTYDEAVETPLDPAWDGGSWYGAASGTYWTINPREYADPRKHGPEYEARAWRAVRAEAGAADGPPEPDRGEPDRGEPDQARDPGT